MLHWPESDRFLRDRIIMKVKYVVFAALSVFFLLSVTTVSEAVEAREIDVVRNKGVLDEADFKMIDQFVFEQVGELVNTRNFASIAKIRTVLVSRNSSNTESAQAQYAAQFSESAYKHVSNAFKSAANLETEEQRFRVALNLLILIDGLEDPRLASLAIERFGSSSKAIQYWAVHAVTNDGLAEKLSGGGVDNLRLTNEIVSKLDAIVDSAVPHVLVQIGRFAVNIRGDKAGGLLLKAADKRIASYADWTVEYEIVDAEILKLLSGKTSSSGSNKAAFARRFGQLFSYAMQRYIEGTDSLTEAQKKQLASVLVEVESSCISRMLGLPQSVIKRAIEQQDFRALEYEHGRLFGNGTTRGQLASKLNFDYGQTSDGQKRLSPVDLPSPPNT